MRNCICNEWNLKCQVSEDGQMLERIRESFMPSIRIDPNAEYWCPYCGRKLQ